MRKKKEEEKEEEEKRKEDFRGIILSIRLCSIITQPRSRRKVNRGNSEYASERDRAIRSRLRRKRSRGRPGPRRCDVLVAVSQRERERGESNRDETGRVSIRLV